MEEQGFKINKAIWLKLWQKNKDVDWKVFLFCFLLAMSIWLLNALGQSYNREIQIDVVFTDLPEQKALLEPLPPKLSLLVSASGWDLLSFQRNLSRRNQKLQVSLSEITGKEERIQLEERAINFSSQLKGNLVVNGVQPRNVQVLLEDKKEKKVPVIQNFEVSFQKQFGLSDSIKIEPDSVWVSGPESVVAEIHKAATEKIAFNEVNKTIATFLPLKNEAGAIVNYPEDKVHVKVPVEKLTEISFEKEIQLLNAPPNLAFILIPSTTTVRCQVPLSRYEQIRAEDFEVVVNVKGLDKTAEQSRLLVDLVRKPDFTYSHRLENEFIDFLIFKK